MTMLKMKQEAEERLRRLQEDRIIADLASGTCSSLVAVVLEYNVSVRICIEETEVETS